MLDGVILLLSVLCNGIFGALIVIRNPSATVNRIFGLFSGGVILWTVCNFIASQTDDFTLLFARLSLLFSSVVVALLFWLCTVFPVRKPFRVPWFILFYVLAGLNAVLCLTPLFVQAAVWTGRSVELTLGPWAFGFSAYLLLAIVWCGAVLFGHAAGAERRLRAQQRLFVLGIGVYTIAVFTADVVLPAVTSNWISRRFSPLVTVLFVAIMAYAIIKHRLFDIRPALARAAGFLLSVGIVAALYALLVLAVSVPVISHGRIVLHRNGVQFLWLLPPMIIVAFTTGWLQRTMTWMTRRIFYQEAYDSQAVLNELSDALMRDGGLTAVTQNGLAVLAAALRPAHAALIILDESGQPHAFQPCPPANDIAALVQAASVLTDAVARRDDAPIDSWPQPFVAQDIALVVRLGGGPQVSGVLFYGPRRNGWVYSRQDINLLAMCAKSFGLAINNAKQYEQIAAFADTLAQEVQRATADLQHANQELKTLDSLKDDFINMVSHQLRSPLMAVTEALQMLEHEKMPPAERQRVLRLAATSGTRLKSVVHGMLHAARLQAGHLVLHRTAVDLRALARQAVVQLESVAQKKRQTLVCKMPRAAITIQADRAKLTECLANYLENAIYYSPPDTTIEIALTYQDDRVDITVRDSGMGVPPAERQQLFSRFYRASNARRDHPAGSGIGLFVVRMILRAHGGDAYYRPCRRGSLFGFWLPR